MAPVVNVNYLAVLAAAAASMALGFLWYGPLFGSQWKKLMGITDKSMKEMKMTPVQSMVGGFASTLIMSYVLAHFVDYTRAATFVDGAIAGTWLWLGFVATVQFGTVLWEGKPVKLYVINTLHYLAALVLMGGILAVWA
ncbi:DUF1761 domain-containing protein [Candidatus Woesearchaeota archaeon]|nr:DUF1761 domain-containing protein [Candidatus Woesearchaeota archaeon]